MAMLQWSEGEGPPEVTSPTIQIRGCMYTEKIKHYQFCFHPNQVFLILLIIWDTVITVYFVMTNLYMVALHCILIPPSSLTLHFLVEKLFFHVLENAASFSAWLQNSAT